MWLQRYTMTNMIRNALRLLNSNKILLCSVIVMIAGAAVIVYPTIQINARIDNAEYLSAQAQSQNPTHACRAFTARDARSMFGPDMVMNNARLNRATGKFTYDGILYDDQGVTVSSCNYASSGRSAHATTSVKVSIRDTATEAARQEQYTAFEQNFPYEKPITVGQFEGFYDDSHSGVGLRLWVKDRWFDVNAPTLDDAKRVISTLISNA